MAQELFNAEIGFGIEGITADTDQLNGTADPSQAPGVVAPISSVYYRDEGTDATIWQKVGPADTDWQSISSQLAQAGIIGTAEDGTYTDGLFTDFVDSTPTGTAVDRFNEVLKALAPAPAPDFSAITCADTGVSGKLSFGTTNAVAGYTNVDASAGGSVVDINGSYSASGSIRGLFNGSVTINGVLNDQVAAEGLNYPANAFAPGNSGTLTLEINGATEHVVDLSVFSSGATLNANGSGFNLTATTATQFEDGTPFDQFQYRTGTWQINPADQNDGFNYARVIMDDGVTRNSNYFEWVNDSDADALTASGGLLDAVLMTGSRHVSGVEYNTGGTAQYDATVQHPHENVYSSSASAISFNTSNCSVSSQALANIASEVEDEVITNKSVTISTGRLLDASISVGINCDHPLKTNLSNGASATANGILIDTVTTANNATRYQYNEETNRVPSNTTITDQASVSSVTWDSTVDLSGATAGYLDGLLQYNGAVRYPTQGLDAGDFRNVADGNVNGPENGPVSNPNYNAVTGNKVILMKFQNNTGLTKANFIVDLDGTAGFTDIATGANAQNITLEMKFPDGSISTGTGWMDAYGNFATDQWADGDGCRDATNGVGQSTTLNWGMTVGTKSIANGEWIVLRITASSAWTGNINDITLTWS